MFGGPPSHSWHIAGLSTLPPVLPSYGTSELLRDHTPPFGSIVVYAIRIWYRYRLDHSELSTGKTNGQNIKIGVHVVVESKVMVESKTNQQTLFVGTSAWIIKLEEKTQIKLCASKRFRHFGGFDFFPSTFDPTTYILHYY